MFYGLLDIQFLQVVLSYRITIFNCFVGIFFVSFHCFHGGYYILYSF